MVLRFLLFFLTSMFWKTGAPGDGSGAAGDPGTGEPPEGGDPAAGSKDPEKTFTQAQLDRVVAERLRRERAQFADYDDLKAKAAAHDAAEEEKKSADQKAAEQRAKDDRATAERLASADRRLIAAEIKVQAAGRVHNPDHVVALLASDPAIKVKGDTVEGVKEALDAFLADEKNAYFVKKEGGTSRSGGEFGGRDSKTLDEQIAEAESAGDWKKSNLLKLQKMRAQQT